MPTRFVKMGWLPSFSVPGASTSASSTSKTSDGGYQAPLRNTREACYESRDIFFDCLDEHDILDANKHDAESRQRCPKEVEAYERDCAKSWIKYFKEKRVMEYNRDRTIEKIQKDDREAARKEKERKGQGERKGWFG